jgi:spore coat protein U-like protein
MPRLSRPVLLSLLLLPSAALAGSSSTSLSVSALIGNNCTISTSAVAFGSYDPVSANVSANLDGTGSVTITCTTLSTPTIGLNTGQHAANASGTTRAMTDGSSHYMSYELYQDTTRLLLWSNSGAGLYDAGLTLLSTPRTFTVYGRVPGGQVLPAGSYGDSVTATVNF